MVAYNTATAAAIELLRAEHPYLPIVGVEPALKPAVALSKTGRIGVMATRKGRVSLPTIGGVLYSGSSPMKCFEMLDGEFSEFIRHNESKLGLMPHGKKTCL